MANGDQFRELIEAYALGALDPQERVSLEAHLASGCADCAKALGEAAWLVSQLAYLVPEAQPPGMLRGRLLQTVRAEARSAPPPEIFLGNPLLDVGRRRRAGAIHCLPSLGNFAAFISPSRTQTGKPKRKSRSATNLKNNLLWRDAKPPSSPIPTR